MMYGTLSAISLTDPNCRQMGVRLDFGPRVGRLHRQTGLCVDDMGRCVHVILRTRLLNERPTLDPPFMSHHLYSFTRLRPREFRCTKTVVLSGPATALFYVLDQR